MTTPSEKSILEHRAAYLYRQARQTNDPVLAKALTLRALRIIAALDKEPHAPSR